MLRKLTGICVIVCLLFSCAAPAPPKRTFFDVLDDGANLEVTMKFIQNALNSIGSFEYSDNTGWTFDGKKLDTFVQYDGEQRIEDVLADPITCHVQYRMQRTFAGKTEVDRKKIQQIELRQPLEVNVFSQKEQFEGINKVAGPGQVRHDFSVPIFVLRIHSEPLADHSFLIFDEKLADEIARAMNHAISLCEQH